MELAEYGDGPAGGAVGQAAKGGPEAAKRSEPRTHGAARRPVTVFREIH